MTRWAARVVFKNLKLPLSSPSECAPSDVSLLALSTTNILDEKTKRSESCRYFGFASVDLGPSVWIYRPCWSLRLSIVDIYPQFSRLLNKIIQDNAPKPQFSIWQEAESEISNVVKFKRSLRSVWMRTFWSRMISGNTAAQNHTILLAMYLLYRRTKDGDVSAVPHRKLQGILRPKQHR